MSRPTTRGSGANGSAVTAVVPVFGGAAPPTGVSGSFAPSLRYGHRPNTTPIMHGSRRVIRSSQGGPNDGAASRNSGSVAASGGGMVLLDGPLPPRMSVSSSQSSGARAALVSSLTQQAHANDQDDVEIDFGSVESSPVKAAGPSPRAGVSTLSRVTLAAAVASGSDISDFEDVDSPAVTASSLPTASFGVGRRQATDDLAATPSSDEPSLVRPAAGASVAAVAVPPPGGSGPQVVRPPAAAGAAACGSPASYGTPTSPGYARPSAFRHADNASPAAQPAQPPQPSRRPATGSAPSSAARSVSGGLRFNIGRKELLGKGSFGSVFKAMDLDTNRIVAVKELPVVAGPVPLEHIAALRGELELMQSLDHPNIVRCLGGQYAPGDSYFRIFMEYVPGGSMAALLRLFGPLSEGQAARYTVQVLEGLRYLHSRPRPCAHRDLKGDNILVDVDGTVKLADFGTARELATLSRTVAGTAWFMAPEVVRGIGAGIEADVWSLGACVFQMLTGSPPFADSRNEFAVMMRIVGAANMGALAAEGNGSGLSIEDGEPVPLPPGISDACRDFLQKCFTREPKARATAASLLSHPWLVSAPNSATAQHAPEQILSLSHAADVPAVGRGGRTDAHQALPLAASAVASTLGWRGASDHEVAFGSLNPVSSFA